jgi:hypothetical protein
MPRWLQETSHSWQVSETDLMHEFILTFDLFLAILEAALQ